MFFTKRMGLVLLTMLAVFSPVLFAGGQSGDTSTGDEAANAILNPVPGGMPIVQPGNELELSFAVHYQSARYISIKEAPVWLKVQEVTGITINWELSPDNTSFQTSMKTRLASGQNLPDMFKVPGSISDSVKYAEEGVIIPLNDLIEEYGPNIKKLYATYPSIKSSATSPDGETYALINYLINNENTPVTQVRKDWLDNLGLGIPETADDWYNALLAIKNSDVNNTGQDDIIAYGSYMDYFMSGFNMTSRAGYYWYDDNNKISFFAVRPEHKDYLMFLNKLYEADLLDPMYGSGETMVGDLYLQNKVFAIPSWAAEPPMKEAELKAAGFPEAEWEYVLPPKSRDGSQSFKTLSVAWNNNRWAISSDSENPVAALRLYDFLYASEQGTRLILCGFEGEHWVIDNNGELQFTDKVMKDPTLNMIGYLRTHLGAFIVPMGIHSAEFNKARIKGVFAHNLQMIQDSGAGEQFPALIPTAKEQETEGILFSDIQSFIDEMTIKFVTGKESFDKYDAFVQTLKTQRIDELTAVYQAQYDRYLGN